MKLIINKREWLLKIGWALCGLILLVNPNRAPGAALSTPGSVTLAWNRNSGPSAEVAGYRVYYGTTSRMYTNSVAVGNVTRYVVSGLTGGVTYFFAVTDYNTDGLESGFSKELHYMSKSSKASKTRFPVPMNVASAMSAVPSAVQIYAMPRLSPEIPATNVALPAIHIHMASNSQLILTVSGQTGHTYYIMATQTFADWTVIGAVTLDASGSLDFTDPDAANFWQRFYRTRLQP